MTRNISLLLIFWISCTVAYGQLVDTDIQRGIYHEVDEYPSYPGGQEQFIHDFQTEFIYPVNVLNDNTNLSFIIFLTFVIDEQGKIIEPALVSKEPSAICNEALRVLKRLKSWSPGKKDGKPVKVRYGVSFPILDAQNRSYPFGYQKRLAAVRKFLDESKVYRNGISNEYLLEAIEKTKDLRDRFPLNIQVSVKLAKLLSTLGRYQEAAEQLQSDIELYQRIKYTQYKKDIYRAQDELEAVSLAAMLNELNHGEEVDETYQNVIDAQLSDNDLVKPELRNDPNFLRQESTLMYEKAGLVLRNPEQLNSMEVAAIDHEKDILRKMGLIDKGIAAGKISNARVIQITKELQDLRKDVVKLSDEKQMLGYLKQKLLLVWLSQGYDAKKNYLQSLLDSNDLSKTIKSSVSRLMADDRRLGADKVSHTELLRTFVSVAPVQSGNRKDDKALADRFYQVKKMLSPYVK